MRGQNREPRGQPLLWFVFIVYLDRGHSLLLLSMGRYFYASLQFMLSVLPWVIVTQQLKYFFINNALRSIYIVRVQLAGC